MRDVTITFTIKDAETDEDAQEMGQAIAEHVIDTFNDDDSISPLVHVKAQKPKLKHEQASR